MWTIPLFKVQDALSQKAAKQRARLALERALSLAGENLELQQAIRSASLEARLDVIASISGKPQAISRGA